MLWVIVFVTTERKTSSTANDATGSSPVECSSGTTQIRTKGSSFPARKTGEILVAQNSGGRTSTTEFCPSQSGRKI